MAAMESREVDMNAFSTPPANRSCARHAKWDMSKVFKQFDFDGDGYLTIEELQSAFKALGLKRRTGKKLEVDLAMFKSFDTNGDGNCRSH